MRPNGKLFLFEQVLPERVRATPAHRRATLSDLNMLVMTTGKERTESQFAQLLNSSGLEKEELLPTASAFSLIRAKLAN
jgi:orsellinic acid C2-O-methyltransferase